MRGAECEGGVRGGQVGAGEEEVREACFAGAGEDGGEVGGVAGGAVVDAGVDGVGEVYAYLRGVLECWSFGVGGGGHTSMKRGL